MTAPGTRVSALGMAWYRAETFAEMRAMMTDSHLLDTTYEKWRYSALKGEEKFRRAGHTVIRAHLDPDTFPAFCRERGLDLDAKGRMEFASFKAAEMVRAQNR